MHTTLLAVKIIFATTNSVFDQEQTQKFNLVTSLNSFPEERNRINRSNKLTHLQIPQSSQWNCPFAVCNECNQIKLASTTNVKQVPFIKEANVLTVKNQYPIDQN